MYFYLNIMNPKWDLLRALLGVTDYRNRELSLDIKDIVVKILTGNEDWLDYCEAQGFERLNHLGVCHGKSLRLGSGWFASLETASISIHPSSVKLPRPEGLQSSKEYFHPALWVMKTLGSPPLYPAPQLLWSYWQIYDWMMGLNQLIRKYLKIRP